MKLLNSRSLPWLVATGAVIALTGFVVLPQLFGSNESDQAPASTSVISTQTGGSEAIKVLEKTVADNPDDFVSHINLAFAYLQRVRETGDPSLYTVAENVLAKAEKIDPGEPELYAAQALLALARHEFSDALVLADKALALDPEQPRYYGLRADAQIEMGLYPEAIESLQNMADRRPDFALYTRMAFARELYGDPEGAIEALQAAVEAGSSVPENMAWAYSQLGDRSFELGDFKTAGEQYARALGRMADHPGALAGQARLAVMLGDYDTAVTLLEKAFERAPLAEYAISLGDIYATTGRMPEAEKQYTLVAALEKLQSENGVNTEVDFALFRADHGIDLPQTIERARAAYAERPSIFAADALAWALQMNGDSQEARKYSLEAMRLGSQNPLLLYRAGVIAEAVGETAEARERLRVALRGGPAFSILRGADAAARYENLQKAAAQN